MEFNIILPLAPSINHYWRHRKYKNRIIVHLSEEGRKYKSVVFQDILSYRVNNGFKWDHILFPEQRLEVNINIFPATRHKQDIDNRIKVVNDCLQAANIYTDDNQIDRLIVERKEIIKSGKMEIFIKEIQV